jgi:hypothetical protein
MGTAVSAPRLSCVLEAGDPTVFGPPFPLLPISVVLVVLPAGVGAPRDFMAPSTCGGLCCRRAPKPHRPAVLHALTWNYVKVLRTTTRCLTLLYRVR